MNNLENNRILSDDLLDTIDIIVRYTPEVIFGGSLSLNAVGLLNREIGDLDLFYSKDTNLMGSDLFTKSSGVVPTSETTTDVNGENIKRIGLMINNVKCCCFKLNDKKQLQHSLFTFTRNGITRTIRLQNVNYTIQAKIAFSSRNEKHKFDLDEINKLFHSSFDDKINKLKFLK